MQIVVPATLLIIFLLLYLNFRRLSETLIVMLSLPFSLVGGLWLMDYMGFNYSVATIVGFIALAGVAAETGVVMLIYLDHALKDDAGEAAPAKAAPVAAPISTRHHGRRGRARAPENDDGHRHHGGAGADPLEHGTGSEVMQRIAVPMIGGMVSSTVLTLIVIPAIYGLVKGR